MNSINSTEGSRRITIRNNLLVHNEVLNNFCLPYRLCNIIRYTPISNRISQNRGTPSHHHPSLTLFQISNIFHPSNDDDLNDKSAELAVLTLVLMLWWTDEG